MGRKGACELGPKVLVWKPDMKEKCKYIKHTIMNGRVKGSAWLAENGLIALTNSMNKTVVECGIELFVSDHEIAYTIIPESNHSSPVYGRRVRSIDLSDS